MSRDKFIKEILSNTVCMTPNGFIADELEIEEFKKVSSVIFKNVFEISKGDITNIQGYGEFNDENKLEYSTCREFLVETFAEDKEGNKTA